MTPQKQLFQTLFGFQQIRQSLKKAGVYIFVTLLCSTSFAEKATVYKMNLVFNDVLDRVALMGVTKIGGKPLPEIKKLADAVTFEAEDQVQYQDNDNKADNTRRESAQWNKEGPNYISRKHWKFVSWESFRHVMTHETLPRAGVVDDNFVPSSELETLLYIQEQQKENPQLRVNPVAITALADRLNASKEGGVTGVGGGGDYRIAEYMRFFILNIFIQIDEERMPIPLFNKIMTRVESLKVNFREDLPADKYIYLPKENKLLVTGAGLTRASEAAMTQSVQALIAELSAEALSKR